jgi:nucleoside-diphosphate-sugar epimerase
MRAFLLGAESKLSVGFAIAERLLAQGHSVVALTKFETNPRQLLQGDIEYITGELVDSRVQRKLADADAVIDTALPFVFGAKKTRHAELRPCLLRRALAGTGKPLIVTSDFAVLGNTGPVPVDETAPVHPLRGFAWLARVEQEILSAKDVRGMVIRKAVEYREPFSEHLISAWMSLALECGRGTYIKSGKNCWSAIQLEDLADLYCLALSKARSGMLIHAASETFSMRDLAGAIHRGLGLAGEPSGISLEEAKRLTPAASRMCCNWALSGELAKRRLAWRPIRKSILNEIEKQAIASRSSLPKVLRRTNQSRRFK